MRGLSVNLKGSSSDVEFEEKKDFDLVIQNAMVNLGQRLGSSKIFPKKGTDILQEALAGGVIDPGSANRIGGTAAVQTLFFLRENEFPEVEETIRDISVLPDVHDNGSLKFQVGLKSTLDRSFGINLNL